MGDVVTLRPRGTSKIEEILDMFRDNLDDLESIIIMARTKNGGLLFDHSPATVVDLSVYAKRLDNICNDAWYQEDELAAGVDEPSDD